MSGEGWDVIGSVLGGVLGTAIGGPVGGVLGATGGYLGTDALQDSPPPQAPAKPPPYPGSAPGVPPYPTLPPPPGTNVPGSGGAADAAGADAAAVAQIVEHLQELDKDAAATVEAIHAAGSAGRQALEGIQRDVDAKIAQLGPRLNSPDGQKELREFLKDKLSSAKKIIDDQIADAEAKARRTREMTQQYLDAAGGKHDKPGDGGGQGGGSGGGEGSGGGGTDQGTTPAAAPATPATPVGQQGMMPGMPGAGMMPAGMPMPSMPSFGGGGMPGMGGGDPFSALSGLAGQGAHGQDPGFEDGSHHPEPDSPKLHDAANGADSGSDKGSDVGTKPAADHGSGGAGAESAGNQLTHPDGSTGPDGGIHVPLPDGSTVDARTTQGASAARAALGGATVADAWHQSGVTVPPPGTPVTAPIPPTLLKAGDVGVWKDHLVMALGSNKVLVSGQVQPLSSVGSGPDFLGWMDPSAGKSGGQNASFGGPSTAPPAGPPPGQPS